MDLKKEYVDIIAAAAEHLELLTLSGVSMLPALPVEKRAEATECVKCRLHRGRTNAVRGEGSAKARLMFVGGAPGSAEDICGRPFSGPDGELLTKIIKAMDLNREDVYLCYALRCRAPEALTLLDAEISSCRPFLEKEVIDISPRVIVTLGELATSAFLGKTPFNGARGRFHAYGDILIMPTYDPKTLLKRPELKKDVWKDMQAVVEALKKTGPN